MKPVRRESWQRGGEKAGNEEERKLAARRREGHYSEGGEDGHLCTTRVSENRQMLGAEVGEVSVSTNWEGAVPGTS